MSEPPKKNPWLDEWWQYPPPKPNRSINALMTFVIGVVVVAVGTAVVLTLGTPPV